MPAIELRPLDRPLVTGLYLALAPRGHLAIDFAFDDGRMERLVAGVAVAAGDIAALRASAERQIRKLATERTMLLDIVRH